MEIAIRPTFYFFKKDYAPDNVFDLTQEECNERMKARTDDSIIVYDMYELSDLESDYYQGLLDSNEWFMRIFL